MTRTISTLALVAAISSAGWVMWHSNLTAETTTEEAPQTEAEAEKTEEEAKSDTVETEQATADEAEETDKTAEELAPEMILGNPDAAVTVIEYASFTCPHCADFHADSFKKLKADYIDTGKIKFIYREVYFDRPGLWASMVARCGGEEKFFGIADMIYQSQSTWARAETPRDIVDELLKIGRLAGVESDKLDACMQDEATARALVERDAADREADGVTGTPNLFINGEKHSNGAYSDLQEALDKALGE